MPGVRSAAVGVFVQVGSRDEAAQLNGASHFLEHLLFKGTPTRSAMDISAALDEVGGEFNAYTAREYTCYHARVLDEDLPMALDVLGDMVTSSLITSEDLEAERDVILDEIAMHDDDPDDVVHNLFAATAWAGTPLARPIAGTTESIKALTRAQVNGYYRRRYRPEVMTVAVAGNIDHADVVRRTRKAFSRGGFLDGDAAPAGPRVAERPRPLRSGEVSRRPALRAGQRGARHAGAHPVRPAALRAQRAQRRPGRRIELAALPGGPRAPRTGLLRLLLRPRLLRRRHGRRRRRLVCPARPTTCCASYGPSSRGSRESGLSEEEVERGKGQARGGLVLSLEDSGSRMSRLGEAELFQRRLRSVDDVLEHLDAVTADDVHALAASSSPGRRPSRQWSARSH